MAARSAPVAADAHPRLTGIWIYAGRRGACGLALLLIVPLSGQQRPQVLSRLTWFDRAGTRLGGIGPVADHGTLELSPDGTRVAVAVTDRTLGTRCGSRAIAECGWS